MEGQGYVLEGILFHRIIVLLKVVVEGLFVADVPMELKMVVDFALVGVA